MTKAMKAEKQKNVDKLRTIAKHACVLAIACLNDNDDVMAMRSIARAHRVLGLKATVEGDIAIGRAR